MIRVDMAMATTIIKTINAMVIKTSLFLKLNGYTRFTALSKLIVPHGEIV